MVDAGAAWEARHSFLDIGGTSACRSLPGGSQESLGAARPANHARDAGGRPLDERAPTLRHALRLRRLLRRRGLGGSRPADATRAPPQRTRSGTARPRSGTARIPFGRSSCAHRWECLSSSLSQRNGRATASSLATSTNGDGHDLGMPGGGRSGLAL